MDTFGNVGDRVRAVNFGPSKVVDDNITVPAGTLGTIDHIDGTGTRHTKWDNGRTIGLIPNVDQWDVLPSFIYASPQNQVCVTCTICGTLVVDWQKNDGEWTAERPNQERHLKWHIDNDKES